MKLLSVMFLAILLALHAFSGDGAAPLPLSMFRDGPLAVLGYLAFVPLIAIGPFMVCVAWKARDDGAAWFYALSTVVMLFIAVTPSESAGHVFWSLILPLAFYVYYARVLFEAESFGVFAHLLVPCVLGVLAQCLGLWQKFMIVYFLIVANIHYRVLLAECGGAGAWPDIRALLERAFRLLRAAATQLFNRKRRDLPGLYFLLSGSRQSAGEQRVQ